MPALVSCMITSTDYNYNKYYYHCVHSISAENPPSLVPIVLTLVTENGGNEVLLEEVAQELEKIEQELEIDIELQTVDRFGEEKYH